MAVAAHLIRVSRIGDSRWTRRDHPDPAGHSVDRLARLGGRAIADCRHTREGAPLGRVHRTDIIGFYNCISSPLARTLLPPWLLRQAPRRRALQPEGSALQALGPHQVEILRLHPWWAQLVALTWASPGT